MAVRKDREKYYDDLRRECRRLRTEEELSIKSICQRTGASPSTVSGWLRDIPLSDRVKKDRMIVAGLTGGKKKGYKQPKRKKDRSALAKLAGDVSFSAEQKGRIAEAAVLLRLCVLGFEVYSGEFGKESLDYLVKSPSGSILRLQVKWASSQDRGSPVVKLTTSSGRKRSRRYDSLSFDVLLGYDLESDRVFVYTEAELSGLKRCVSLREENAECWDKLLEHQ